MARKDTFDSGRWSRGLVAASAALVLILFGSGCVFHENNDDHGEESAYGWSWEGGSASTGTPGVYGTKGVASSSNYPGGRGYQTIWFDPAGTMWLFGGHAFESAETANEINDLWKFSPAAGTWTWVSGADTLNQPGVYGSKGTAAAANVPAARDTCASWRDPSGRLWLFGGFGHDSTANEGNLNDLWMFDPSTSMWTWVSGSNLAGHPGVYGVQGTPDPANVPGARFGAVSWTGADGKLWLFGGSVAITQNGNDDFNDLWSFDPETGIWTWVSGSDTKGEIGSYGTMGVASDSNVPGARDASVAWRDASGNFWLFGGFGRSGTIDSGQLSDLWKFDPQALRWTWEGGLMLVNQPGVYGTQGTASAGNIPGGRNGAVAWLDPNGKFWLFGGAGLGETSTVGVLADLWRYDPATGYWTWVQGPKTVNRVGDLSDMGTRYLSNNPGARKYSAGWIDAQGNLWLLGGAGYGASGGQGWLNDMWEYVRQ
jgi:N-acetylneuraminic acid mutarotase